MPSKLLSHRLTRRSFLAGLGAAAALPVLAACQPQVVEKEKIVERVVTQVVEKQVEKVVEKVVTAVPPKAPETVTVSFGTGGAPWLFQMWDRVYNQFEQEFPKIKVDRKYDPSSDWYKVYNKISSGSAEDVILMNDDALFYLSAAGAMTILDDYVKRDLKREDYFDRAWKVRNAPGGEIGALHYGGRVRVTWYNKKLFDDAGIKPATDWVTDNWNIDKWEENMVKLTKKSGERVDQYGAGIIACIAYTWFPNLGLSWWNEDETVSQVNHPDFVALCERIVGWHTKQQIAVRVGENQLALFNAGKLPMYQGFMHDALSFSKDIQWGAMPYMKIKVDPVLSFMEDDTYAIPSSSKVRDQAWVLSKYNVSEKAQWEFGKSDFLVPSLKKVTESPQYLDGNPFGYAGVTRKIWMQAYVYAWKQTTNNPMGEEMARSMCREDGQMVSGQVPVKTYLDTAAQRLTKYSRDNQWNKKNDTPGWRLPGVPKDAGKP